MSTVGLVALVLASLGFMLAAILGGRRLGIAGYWSWSWAALVAAGALMGFQPPGSLAHVVGQLGAGVFVALQLAGAFEFAERRIPRWLLPTALGVCATRAASTALGYEAASHMLVLPFEVAALIGAAALVFRFEPDRPSTATQFFLAAGLLMLAVVQGIDAGLDLRAQGATIPWSMWLVVGTPVAASQIVAIMQRMETRLEESRRARERAEAALDDSAQRFRAIAENMYDIVVETDEEARILYASPRFAQTFGSEGFRTLGYRALELVHPDDRERSRSFLPLLVARGEGVLSPIRIRNRDRLYRWFEVTSRAYTSSDGSRSVVSVMRDVTERIRAERELRNARKLESLGVLAGGIAHDFNNLLTGILGHAELAHDDLGEGHPARAYLEEVVDGCERTAALTQQLLVFAGGGPVDMQRLELGAQMREFEDRLRELVPAQIELEIELPVPGPTVIGDRVQIERIMTNLIGNAVEASGEGAKVRLELDEEQIADARRQVAVGALLPGRYARISVRDEGAGFDHATAELLFDPFFTTRFTGRGLGLAVVQSTVRSHGGAITVESHVGEGSCFVVYLPATEPGAHPFEPDAPALEPSARRILVVDDDPGVRRVACSALERNGWNVDVACDGVGALEAFEKAGGAYDLLLLDATMPDVSGLTLLERMRRIRRDVPVLVTSGYSESDVRQRFATSDVSGFVGKPFTPQLLASRVEALLGKS